ncbi:MAG: D-2-hydroxyacid dehydrogenase [Deltaproteobacteria bacterium]|nr:D-2-hydroxyacid dehydrogenase [Deltaproteobacteria bacterium]
MNILIYLKSEISSFQVNDTQFANLVARLSQHNFVRVTSKEEFKQKLPETDAAVVWSFPAHWYALAPKLKHVFTPAAGHDWIAPDPQGQVSIHFGKFHGKIMAESLLAMMLFMNRQLGVAIKQQRDHVWAAKNFESCRRIVGQTALIIGYGAIGQHIARLLSAIGMTVYGLRRTKIDNTSYVKRLFTGNELHEALTFADHVVCILPGDTTTDNFLDAAAFAKMKPGAIVYNLGRGNTIDHNVLVAALNSGAIAGAFLDVLPKEPLPPTSSLWDTPKLYFSPHAAAVYAEYLDLYFKELAELINKLGTSV